MCSLKIKAQGQSEGHVTSALMWFIQRKKQTIKT